MLFSIATCINDDAIPQHMQKWFSDLKLGHKTKWKNRPKSNEEEEAEKSGDDGSSSDDGAGPPTKWMRMSNDAQIVQAGDKLLISLNDSRTTRSMSCISRSSRASSVISFGGLE